MTITFSIEGIQEETGDELPCLSCGETLLGAMHKANGDRNEDCPACFGYGGPETVAEPRFELNVSNVNAGALLRHLGIEFDYCGEVSPQDLLTALAVRSSDELMVEAPHSEGNWHYGGRSAEQVARYVAKLEQIATMAAKYDRRVVWS